MYNITVTWLAPSRGEQAVYSLVKDYQITGNVLTLAIDFDHDLIIPLHGVETVEVKRQK